MRVACRAVRAILRLCRFSILCSHAARIAHTPSPGSRRFWWEQKAGVVRPCWKKQHPWSLWVRECNGDAEKSQQRELDRHLFRFSAHGAADN